MPPSRSLWPVWITKTLKWIMTGGTGEKKNPEALYKWLSIQLSLHNLSHKNEAEIHETQKTIYYTGPAAQSDVLLHYFTHKK